MAEEITFSEEFLEICLPLFGITKAQAIQTIRAYDKVERLERVRSQRVHLFLKYFEEKRIPYCVLLVVVAETNLEIFYALKAYASLANNFFQLNPTELLDRLIDTFGVLNSEHQEFANSILAFVISSTYLDWLGNNGRSSDFEREIEEIRQYAAENILPAMGEKTFKERVFLTMHDFCFYCRQHPKALGALSEEQIRDLYLVVLKCIFSYAGGETFHFDGKLDFQIRNPENQYEIVTGEFKWWTSKLTAKQIFHQAVRKHATGQEVEIYAVLLSKNVNAKAVFKHARGSFEKELETIPGSYRDRIPVGSKESFGAFDLSIRGNQVPLCLGIGDFYHKNV